MKKSLLLAGVAFAFIGCGASQDTTTTKSNTSKATADPVTYAQTITEDELRDLLFTYASDEFQGRETGEPGQKMAVDYLRTQYMNMGVPSPLQNDDYFQEVPLENAKSPDVSLSVNDQPFDLYTDFISTTTVKDQKLDLKEYAYAAYGIEDGNYNDYANLDVKGKFVVIKNGEPKNSDGTYVTTNAKESTKWSGGRQSLRFKRDLAIEKGAKGVIIMDQELFVRYSKYYQSRAASGKGSLSLVENNENEMSLLIGTKLGNSLVSDILNNDKPQMFESHISINIRNKSELLESENVVAFIKGSELPNEILVISAHLDHEGIKDGEIYNGADDDGSGTVALLEIAEAFKMAQKDGNGPKRSILFLHVTGEEKGLLGSRYYSDFDPIFPLENTVANLNIDMIGRIDPNRKGDRNYVYLIGADKLSTELHEISEAMNSKYTNIELDYKFNDENDPNRFYYRSDHYNFAKNNIPVIFYFNGTHDDYHKPSDTPDKINYDLLENRTKLVFHTAWELANRADRITVDKAQAVKK
ncbi:MAG: peptidase [Bacteroidetes bacterium MedPE-SWsnd-G2]|nr:MAG: peptidase [Bacteroidetes bacterium MedPE-SWsnd-G2]